MALRKRTSDPYITVVGKYRPCNVKPLPLMGCSFLFHNDDRCPVDSVMAHPNEAPQLQAAARIQSKLRSPPVPFLVALRGEKRKTVPCAQSGATRCYTSVDNPVLRSYIRIKY